VAPVSGTTNRTKVVEQVYITQSNAARIAYRINPVALSLLTGEVYRRDIPMLSNRERLQLLAVRKFFENPELVVAHYVGVVRSMDDSSMVCCGCGRNSKWMYVT